MILFSAVFLVIGLIAVSAKEVKNIVIPSKNITAAMQEVRTERDQQKSVLVGEEDKVLLKSRAFGIKEKLSDEAKNKILSKKTGKPHIILQFDHIPTISERAELKKEGINLISYIPHNAWFAVIESNKIDKIKEMKGIKGVSDIIKADKISQNIIDRGISEWAKNTDGTVNLTIMFFKDASLDDAKKVMQKYGQVNGEAPIANSLVVTVDESFIPSIADEDIVQWIEEKTPPPRLFNDGSRGAIGANEVQAPPYSFNGSGVMLAMWDEWHPRYNHNDLSGRTHDYGTSGYADHATHVAGTMLGSGTSSPFQGGSPLQWRGMAPKAHVWSYKWWNNIAELNIEYSNAINAHNASLSQNSWGTGPSTISLANCEAVLGNYFIENAALDDVVKGSLGKPISIVWAAGNDRSSGSSYCGSIGLTYHTVSPYGTSKNVITVGAINSNDDSMTSFSSWGPVDDGRLKPDVVAAGCQTDGDLGITSTGSSSTTNYTVMCGTSMAAPAVSGGSAQLIEAYKKTHNSNITSSMLKALLIHASKDLGNIGPDYQYGYGKVNITASVVFILNDSQSNDILVDGELMNGNTDVYNISVSASSQIKITLVWDDDSGQPNAGKELVNDLDLYIENSSGTKYYPWILDPASPSNAAATGNDTINVVEQVIVDSPADGNWKVVVNGSSLPSLFQKYSIVSSHHLERPIISNTECQENNSVWVNCSTIQYNDYLTKVKANCSYYNNVSNVNFKLASMADYYTFFDGNYTSFESGYYVFDNSDILMRDSGEFKLIAECSSGDLLSHKADTWNVPFGYLESYLIDPVANKEVAKNKFFNFSAGVRCIRGECGDVNGTLSLPPYSSTTCSNIWGFSCTTGPPESSDNTFDSCGYGAGGDESINEMYLDKSGIEFGETIAVTCYFDAKQLGSGQYYPSDDFYIYYRNSSSGAWVQKYAVTDNVYPDTNYSVSFVPDSIEGEHQVRCIADYDPENDECAGGSYYDNDDANFSVYALHTSGKGKIPMGYGTPFYTISQNPAACPNMGGGDSCNSTWEVNATGNDGTYSLFSYYEAINYSDDVTKNQTSQVNIIIFENIPPVVSNIQCQENNSIWEGCSNITYRDYLTAVRANCTDSDSVIGANFILKNIQDDYVFFNSTGTQSGDIWAFNNADIEILDSGDFNLTVSCIDNLGYARISYTNWTLPFGVLQPYMIEPLSNINVTQNSLFSFSSGVRCINGECGNINATLDPAAPLTEFNKTFGGSSNDYGYSVQQATDGGYIFTGSTNSFGAGGYDAYLIKTDSSGNMQWNKTFGDIYNDYGRSVQKTSDNGYIITGYTYSFTAGANADVYLIKTNSSGDMQWSKNLGGSNSDYGYSIEQTSDNGYIIAGNTMPSFYDAYLIKTDSSGNMQWNKTFGGSSNDYGYSAQQTNDGGYILIGYTNSFGAGNYDVWLIKTDSNGNMQWNKTFGGLYGDFGYSVLQTNDNGYIIAGYRDPSGTTLYDVYLIKTDFNGNQQWYKTFGGSGTDYVSAIQKAHDSGYIITGSTNSFGASTDVYLIKTDFNGNQQWYKTSGGSSTDKGYFVRQTSDNGYIAVGETNSFGAGSIDIYLIKTERDTIKGVVPMNSGTPFYTITQNPATCTNMKGGDSCNSTWQVNATGDVNRTWEFYTFYSAEEYISYVKDNKTNNINVTIKAPCVDSDGDGYSITGGCGIVDCNDLNSSIYPGAIEICNNEDDNCAAGADEGCDDDNDNYCDSAINLTSSSTCASGGNDCSDNNASVYPPSDGADITTDTLFCPGAYYLPSGITIGANNIALDCNGTIMIGNQSGDGVYLGSISGVTVRNCNIYNYSIGISLFSSNNNKLAANAVNNASKGISLSSSSNYNTLNNNTVYNSAQYGIHISNGKNNSLINNHIENNSFMGMEIDISADNNISNNKIVKTAEAGIYLFLSDNNSVLNNLIINSSSISIAFQYANNNILNYNNLTSKGGIGFRIGFDSKYNVLKYNSIFNSSDAFAIIDSSGNNISDNILVNNSRGFYLHNASFNSVTGNTVEGNAKGFYLLGNNTNNFIRYNNIYNNSDYNLMNIQPENTTAENNWWGTTNITAINNSIYDYYDDNATGIVDYCPLLSAPYPNGVSIGCFELYGIYLTAGWNLFSLPLNATNKTIGSLFAAINYSYIFYYNSSDKKWLMNKKNNASISNLSSINKGDSYWIKMLENSALTIQGAKIESANFSLTKGWNLISYPSIETKPINETFNVDFESILAYENNSWKSYSKDKPSYFNTLKNMTPGYGYWVKVSNDANWTFNGTFNPKT